MSPFSLIQILGWILAGFFYCSKCSDSSKMDGNNPDDLIHHPASSANEASEFNFETTMLPDYDVQTSLVSVEEVIPIVDSNVSDAAFEDVYSNGSEGEKSNSKRDASQAGWNHADKMRCLHLHNLYRGNVTPPAGNMAFMEWDTELERLAQLWANNCTREHGGYDIAANIGQNIDIDTDLTGYNAIYRWYEERRNYDLRTGHCLPGKKCWHYMQLAWAESSKLGCAVAKCDISYYFVCYYIPAALHGVQIYRVGEPCSHCSGKNVLCGKNLCMTQQQCKNNPFSCQDAECNLKCHNCGRLDNETCSCECSDGWDGRDCSQLCKNKDKMCERKGVGYSDKNSCPLNNHAVANTLCRKMCETCHAVQETSSNTCCEAKLCEEGYVHDPSGKTCECEILCPGPVCDCPSFEMRKDMSIVYSKSKDGEIVATFSCHNNMKLVGSNSSECQPDGKWSTTLPLCEDITCPLFEMRKNMRIVYSKSNKVDSVAAFICHNDTKLVGSKISECQPDGEWSNSLPYCEDCPLFEIRKDIIIEYSESDEGASVATFSCHNKTKLVGFKSSECQPDGKWSNSLPYCEYDVEAILKLAAVIGGGAESLRTFPSVAIWMVLFKLVELYTNTLSRSAF